MLRRGLLQLTVAAFLLSGITISRGSAAPPVARPPLPPPAPSSPAARDVKPPAPTGPRAKSPVALPVIENGRVIRTTQQREFRVVIDETDTKLLVTMNKPVETRGKGQFREGDTVKLAKSSALQEKGQPDLTLKDGTVLGVRAVDPGWGKAEWVRASTIDGGKVRTGWVRATDVQLVSSEGVVAPQLRSLIGSSPKFAAASVLIQKAKIFDDGLMATAQIAAQQGLGTMPGKSTWLPALTNLENAPPVAETLLAATQLGKLPVPVPAARQAGVEQLTRKFLDDPLRSKPIGFYTWSPELSALFQQDRMLQSPLKSADLLPTVTALQNAAATRNGYEKYVSLIARLTNPPVGADLRTLLAGKAAGNDVALISASQAPETNLIKALFENRPIPEGFDLSSELVTRIRGGKLSLKPTENSGWYDQQLWSLEPLVTPDRTPEAVKWKSNEEYRKHLESVQKLRGGKGKFVPTHQFLKTISG